MRELVDGSVEHVEELRREQQLDEMQERYKKPEEEKMDAWVDVTITLDEDAEPASMTGRQREVQKVLKLPDLYCNPYTST